VLFAKDGLSNGIHTIEIAPKGERNAQSGGHWVWVDAFETVTRVEENDAAVAYSCSSGFGWYPQLMALHSSAAAVAAMTPSCRAAFSFNGSGVSWIGNRDQWSGIARVSIDGVVRAEIDTYASPAETNAVVYTLTGLPAGPHTLTIEPAGRAYPASGGLWVWIDAFEAVP
jgi:hypothetical protein